MSTRIARTLLLVASLVFSLVIGELAVRVLLPEIGERPRRDDALGWSVAVDTEFLHTNGEDDRNALRILVVGDSYLTAAGPGTRAGRFPNLLDERFRPRARVRSLAAGGWGTDQELLAVLQEGFDWQPDLIVLTFIPNDLSNNLAYAANRVGRKPYFVLDEGGDLQLYSVDDRPIPLVRTPVARRSRFDSYLWSLVRYRIALREDDSEAPPRRAVDPRYIDYRQVHEARRAIVDLAPRLDWIPFAEPTTLSAYVHGTFPLVEYQWRLYERIVLELKERAEAAGAQLVLMLLPVTYVSGDLRFVVGSDFEHEFDTPGGPFTFRSAVPRERLTGIAGRLDLDLLDPTDDFLRILVERNLVRAVWPGKNRHFSTAGHEVLAEIVAPWVEARLKDTKRTVPLR